MPADACLIIGDIREGRPVYLVEGIGQAWSAHQATSCAAVVCFGWARVAGVAKALRAKYPAARLVIVPDAGMEDKAAEIARKVRGAFCEMPEGSPRNFDLNDLHQGEGLKAVASLLEQAKEPPQRFRVLTPADISALPPVRWRVRGVLPADGIAALFGASGAGKSFLALDLLGNVASGAEWFGCRVTPAPVLYIGLEGEAGIAQRLKAHQTRHGEVSGRFRFILQPLDIRKPADRADLIAAAQAAGYSDGVLCIDTLNRAAPGADENDSAANGRNHRRGKGSAKRTRRAGAADTPYRQRCLQRITRAFQPARCPRCRSGSNAGRRPQRMAHGKKPRMAMTGWRIRSGWKLSTWAPMATGSQLQAAASRQRKAPGTWYAGHCLPSLETNGQYSTP